MMNCGDCIFKIMDDGPPMSGGPFGGGQIGCKANRVQKFIDKGAASLNLPKQCYELKQFCNMHRQELWLEEFGPVIMHGANLLEEAAKLARKEVTSTFGIALFDNHTVDMQTFEKSIDNIVSSARDYGLDKVKIVVAFQQNRPVSQTLHMINEYSNQDVYIMGTTVFDPIWNVSQELEKEIFQKIVNQQYFIKLKVGEVVPDNLFSKIDKIVNDDLKQVSIFESESAIACHVGIVREAYLEFQSYDKMVDHLLKISRDGANYCKI
jgi:hypothetical protein